MKISWIAIIMALLIAQPIFAACTSEQCLLQEQLKNNPAITFYKISTPDKNTLKVDGKLIDGYFLKVTLLTGKVFSKTYKKIIPSSAQQHPLTEQTYWIDQILLFAKQILRKTDAELLQTKINHHEFSTHSSKNKLLLEKYNEGYFERIELIQSKKETSIEIQQRAD